MKWEVNHEAQHNGGRKGGVGTPQPIQCAPKLDNSVPHKQVKLLVFLYTKKHHKDEDANIPSLFLFHFEFIVFEHGSATKSV